MNNNAFQTLITLAFSTCLALALAHAQEPFSGAPLDFDGDGETDYGRYSNQNDGSANELVYYTSGGVNGFEFGGSGDTIALGDYDGDGVTDIVVVQEGQQGDPLAWKGSAILNQNFGATGDYVLSGCDFDQDGLSDMAVVNTDRVVEYIASSTSEEGSIELPLSNDHVLQNANCQPGHGLLIGSLESYVPQVFDPSEVPPLCGCKKFKKAGQFDLFDSCKADLASGACVTKKKQKFMLNPPASAKRFILTAVTIPDGEVVEQVIAKKKTVRVMYLAVNGEDTLAALRPKKKNSFIDLFIDGKLSKIKLEVKIKDAQPHYTFTEDEIEGNSLEMTKIFAQDGDQQLYEIAIDSLSASFIGNVVAGDNLLHSSMLELSGIDPNLDPNSLCDSIEPMADGGGGRLLKQAEHGGIVALFPRCSEIAKKVRLLKSGKVISSMIYTGLANPDPCDLRDHFRDYGLNMSKLSNNTIVEATMNNGMVRCYDTGKDFGDRID